MSRIYTSVSELIGGTPLLELKNTEQKYALKARLYAKLEYLNPSGSVKDRAALQMINDAEESGRLKSGGVIIEPTSGNTGIGLASIAAARGYKCIIIMPDTMSIERQRLMAAYGAQLILTDGSKGMQGAIDKAEELHSRLDGSIIAGQFVNEANPQAHINTTGPEIYNDTDGEVDIFIAGVGTGGTLTGTGKYLKSKKPSIKVVAVEPASSPLLSGGSAGAHGIQGIGANFIPSILDASVYDEVCAVEDETAFEYARMIGKTEGFLCGISSGAAVFAAIEQAKRPENEGKNIVIILPDSGERYLSVL